MMTTSVFLSKHAAVEIALTTLSKRLVKKGLAPLTWSWGKAYADVKGRTRLDLTLDTSRPHFNGWNFVATVVHLRQDDGSYENVLRTVPGCFVHEDCKAVGPTMGLACAGVTDLPLAMRTRGPVCDHCAVNRRRNDTYILHHVSGKYAQVGSTCIVDFLGHRDAEGAAFRSEILALAAEIARGGEVEPASLATVTSDIGAVTWGVLLSTYLGYVAWAMRTVGWVSKAAAMNVPGSVSTSSLASNLTWADAETLEAHGYAVVNEDLTLARAAADWAENLTDAEVDAAKDAYLGNLRAIARTGLVNGRVMGTAASMIRAYHFATGKIAKKVAPPKCDRFVGEVGQRYAWGVARKLGKKITKLAAEPVTLTFVYNGENDMGELFCILKFTTADGTALTWKTSGSFNKDEIGAQYTLIGTVKKHEDFRGEKQTVLSRCDLTPVGAVRAQGAA